MRDKNLRHKINDLNARQRYNWVRTTLIKRGILEATDLCNAIEYPLDKTKERKLLLHFINTGKVLPSYEDVAIKVLSVTAGAVLIYFLFK